MFKETLDKFDSEAYSVKKKQNQVKIMPLDPKNMPEELKFEDPQVVKNAFTGISVPSKSEEVISVPKNQTVSKKEEIVIANVVE